MWEVFDNMKNKRTIKKNLVKDISKIVSVFVVVLMVSVSFSSIQAADIYLNDDEEDFDAAEDIIDNSDNVNIIRSEGTLKKKDSRLVSHSNVQKRSLGERIHDFLLSLAERMPHFGNSSLFNRLLDMFDVTDEEEADETQGNNVNDETEDDIGPIEESDLDGDGFSVEQGDCDDNNPSVYPGAPEICGDGIDQDCDGSDLACIQEDESGNEDVIDTDGDGYGSDCDCDDNNPSVYPGAPEIYDGLDNDCDGLVDEGFSSGGNTEEDEGDDSAASTDDDGDVYVAPTDSNSDSNNMYQAFSNYDPESGEDPVDYSPIEPQDSINVSDNISAIPDAGHILFMGYGYAEVDITFQINDTSVALNGWLYLSGSGASTLEISWNIPEGYLEITSDGYFELIDFLISAEKDSNKIELTVDNVRVVGNGYLLLDQYGSTGSFICDGFFELEGISFDLDLQDFIGYTVSFSGFFDFTGTVGEAQDLNLTWDETGLSADGSFCVDAYLKIHDLFLSIDDINLFGDKTDLLISVGLIEIDRSAVLFDFEEKEDSTVMLSVRGSHLKIENIAVFYGGQHTGYIESIEIHHVMNLTLYINSDSYVTAEDGYISISGHIVMAVDSVIDIGTYVFHLRGFFIMQSFDDSLDIRWNKTEGSLRINSSARVTMLDFNLSFDDSFIDIDWEKLVLNTNSAIIIEKVAGDDVGMKYSNLTRVMFHGGIVQTTDMSIKAYTENFRFSIGSFRLMHFEQNSNGYFEVLLHNNTVVGVSANLALGESLVIQNIYIAAAYSFGLWAESLTVTGYWDLDVPEYGSMSLSVEGSVQLVHFSLSVPGAGLGMPYFYMEGTAYMLMGDGQAEFWVNVYGELGIGLSTAGMRAGFSIRLLGYVHMIWDLHTGVIYGDYRYVVAADGVASLDISLGIAYISAISFSFTTEGGGTFTINNSVFMMEISGYASFTADFSFGFSIGGLSFGGGVSVGGGAAYNGSVAIDLRTGDIYYSVTFWGWAQVRLYGFYAYGWDVNIDHNNWYNKKLDPDGPFGFLYYLEINIGKVWMQSEGAIDILIAFGGVASSGGSFGVFLVTMVGADITFPVVIEEFRVSTIKSMPFSEKNGFLPDDPADIDKYIDFDLSIGSIDFEMYFNMYGGIFDTFINLYGEEYNDPGINLWFDGTCEIEDIELHLYSSEEGLELDEDGNYILGDDDGYLNVFFDEITFDGELYVTIPFLVNMIFAVNYPYMPDERILDLDTKGSVIVEGFEFDGFAQDFMGGTAALNGHVGEISLDVGALCIDFDVTEYGRYGNGELGNRGVLSIGGTGSLTFSDIGGADLNGDGDYDDIGEEYLNIDLDNVMLNSKDADGDGIYDYLDGDIDGDGIPNENDLDTDDDGIPNDEDDDIDGDGIPNHLDTDPYTPYCTILNIDSDFSAEEIVFSMEGYLILYDDGTVEADALLEIDITDLHFSIKEGSNIQDIVDGWNVEIDGFNLDIYSANIDCYLKINEGGTKTIEFAGNADFDLGFGFTAGQDLDNNGIIDDIDGDGIPDGNYIQGYGSLHASGRVYAKLVLNPDDTISEVEIMAEGDITGVEGVDDDGDGLVDEDDDGDGIPDEGACIFLGGTCDLLGDWSINVENYHGTDGLLIFRVNADDGSVYLLNSQQDATWDSFSLSLLDGLLQAELEKFYGDLSIENLIVDLDMFSDLGELYQYYLSGGDFEDFDDPEDLLLHSEEGYQTLLGFEFSSQWGLMLQGYLGTGDVPFYGPLGNEHTVSMGITELYVAPGTSGELEIGVDPEGNLLFTFNCNPGGHAEAVFLITYDEIDILINLDSDQEDTVIPLGAVLEFVGDLTTGQIDGLLGPDGLITEIINLIETEGNILGILTNTFVNDEGNIGTLGQYLLDFVSDYVESLPDGPLKEALLDLLELLEDMDASCFLAGTQIEMSDGSLKNIEEIRVGDSVKSYDEITGEWKTGTVSQVFYHSPEEMTDYYLVINNDLCVTPNHPMYVDGEWIDADELELGDVNDGNMITSIKRVYQQVPTYNFEVLPYHTYNVVWGESSKSIVHNAGTAPSGGGPAQSGGSVSPASPDNDKFGGGGGCFLKGTEIKMADGSLKNIENIHIGDEVSSYDPFNREYKNGTVSKVFHHSPEEMTDYYLIINDDLCVTPNHPIIINEGWIDAGELEIGDVYGGNTILSIQKVYERVPTYNFEVEPYHTYNIVWGEEKTSSIAHNAQDAAQTDRKSTRLNSSHYS